MRVVESAFRLFIQRRNVDNYLPFGIELNFRAIHRPRCRAFEVDAFTVVAATVTRTFKFVFARLPVRRAPEMSAARVNYKQPIGGSGHPDSILLLPLCIDAQRVVAWDPDAKHA